jgi:cation:H+ antiporter
VLIPVVLLLAGLVLLTLGADRFVVAAARLSRILGLSPILIGALVIGLGTSAPELLVSALAAGRGELDLALGNIVGSNTANMTLVLGAAALVGPVVSHVKTIRREGVLMFLAMLGLTGMLWDLRLARFGGAMLLAGMAGAAVLLVIWARSDPRAALATESATGDTAPSAVRESLIGLTMLALTLLGADLLVRGASGLAEELGISEAFVGLVIVAIGTSLPELATAMAAARRGETDLIIGNVLGSNLFNTLMVAGTAALVGPGGVDPSFRAALVLMLGAGLTAGVFVVTGRRLARWEGTVLLGVFVVFIAVAGRG